MGYHDTRRRKACLELTRSHIEGEEQAYIWLDGMIGQKLNLMLDDMPPGKYFPTLELYSAKRIDVCFAPSCNSTLSNAERNIQNAKPNVPMSYLPAPLTLETVAVP